MSQAQILERSHSQSILAAGLHFGRTLVQRVSRYRKVRQTYAVLSQMDDHQLADIGLNRSMIMNVSELLDRGRS